MNINIIGILTIIIALILIYPFFGKLIEINNSSSGLYGVTGYSVSLYDICMHKNKDNSCTNMYSMDTQYFIDSISPNFYLIQKLFIIAYSLVVISIFIAFYPPTKKFISIPLSLAIVIYANASLMLLNKQSYTDEYNISVGPGLIVEFVGIGLAFIVMCYCTGTRCV